MNLWNFYLETIFQILIIIYIFLNWNDNKKKLSIIYLLFTIFSVFIADLLYGLRSCEFISNSILIT